MTMATEPQDTDVAESALRDATAWLEGKSLQQVLAEYKTRYAARTAADTDYTRVYRTSLRKALAVATPAAPTRKRSPERIEYLDGVLDVAIGHAGYGFLSVIRDGNHDGAGQWNLVYDRHDEDNYPTQYAEWPQVERRAMIRGEVWVVDIDTIARGMRIIADAVPKSFETYPGSGRYETVRANHDTGERLYFGGEARTNLLLSNRTNGDDGDFDVIGALAVVECALFGRVVYG